MGTKLKTIIMTGDSFRHRYAAHCLANETELVGVLCEAKRTPVSQKAVVDNADRKIIEKHLCDAKAAERHYFGEYTTFPKSELRKVCYGQANSEATFKWVNNKAPDLIVLFGTSIIKAPLLTRYDRKIVNLHLGLSPYYRGAATNFWPLVHGEPECVGATIHLAIQEVDAGAILKQIRPEPQLGDSVHDLGMKTVRKGWAQMPRILQEYVDETRKPQNQDLSHGRVFTRKEFSANSVMQLWSNIDNGMMERYVKDISRVQAKYPIVE